MLTPQPLNQTNFAPYGQVIEVTTDTKSIAINDGTCLRYSNLAQIESDAVNSCINIFRSQPRELPLPILSLERHPLASQAFIPLRAQDFLIVVSAQSTPTANNLLAFHATKGQGINFARNTWHHALIALNTECDFLVVDRAGNDDVNLQICDLADQSTLLQLTA